MMSKQALIGIDIGTSSAKAVLFDPDTAQIMAVAGEEYPILKPQPDNAEQNPDDWWTATVRAVQRVLSEAEDVTVAGISLSGQMHGTILLDASGKPLHNAIIWADQRTISEVTELVEAVGAQRYAKIAGTLPATGFMAATLLWLKKHKPSLLDQTHRVVFPKDYVRVKLTGDIGTDFTDAAGSGIFGVARRAWASDIIQSVGLPEGIFPPAVESPAVVGTLTKDAAAELGLSAGIPVAAGCADQPAQALGNGLVAPGVASVTTGSGGQVFMPLSAPDGELETDSRLHVFNHAVPGMYYVLGATLSAGLSLRWLRGVTNLEGRDDAYGIMSAEAAEIAPGADGLVFLPYLSGERTPHMDPLARGAFIGLSYHHTHGHLTRAIMEGVAFSLRQALGIGLELGGAVEMVIAAGGGADSPVWRQIQADILGLPLRQSLLTEQASIGAALLAGVGAGVYRDVAEARERTVRYGAVTEPDEQRKSFYNERYEQFLALYPRLRDDFHRLSQK